MGKNTYHPSLFQRQSAKLRNQYLNIQAYSRAITKEFYFDTFTKDLKQKQDIKLTSKSFPLTSEQPSQHKHQGKAPYNPLQAFHHHSFVQNYIFLFCFLQNTFSSSNVSLKHVNIFRMLVMFANACKNNKFIPTLLGQ